jgi:hypothetical protein
MVEVISNQAWVAHFVEGEEEEPTNTKQITFDTSDGSIDISYDGSLLKTVTNDIYTGTFEIGKEITVKHTPSEGATFKFWVDQDKFDADESDYDFSYDNPLTFTVNDSCPTNIGVMLQY